MIDKVMKNIDSWFTLHPNKPYILSLYEIDMLVEFGRVHGVMFTSAKEAWELWRKETPLS